MEWSKPKVADGILHPEDVSVDTLRKIFEDAYIETEVDEDGDLLIRDHFTCFVIPVNNGRRIQLLALFSAQPESTLESRLEFANKVNDTLVVVRASVTGNGNFAFDHYLHVAGGLPIRNLVLSVKDFFENLHPLGSLDEMDVLK